VRKHTFLEVFALVNQSPTLWPSTPRSGKALVALRRHPFALLDVLGKPSNGMNTCASLMLHEVPRVARGKRVKSATSATKVTMRPAPRRRLDFAHAACAQCSITRDPVTCCSTATTMFASTDGLRAGDGEQVESRHAEPEIRAWPSAQHRQRHAADTDVDPREAPVMASSGGETMQSRSTHARSSGGRRGDLVMGAAATSTNSTLSRLKVA